MSYIGAGANIIGGELQGWASVLEKKAMFDEFQKEQARQQQYRDQGAGLFQGFLGQNTRDYANKSLAEGRAGREKAYSDVAAIPLSPTLPTQQSSSPARDKAAVAMRGQQRATLGAYSDWALKETLNNIQNQEALHQLSNFAGGTASIFPFKMYKAQHSMDDLAMIGAAISSIGGGAANYAQYAQAPQQQPLNAGLVNAGGYFGPAYGSGYSQVPPGTSYDPYTGQNFASGPLGY